MSRAALLFTSVLLAACSRSAPAPEKETPVATAEPASPAPAPSASSPAASASSPAASASAAPAVEERFPCGGGTCRRGQVCRTPGSPGIPGPCTDCTPYCVEAREPRCGNSPRSFWGGGLHERCAPRPGVARGGGRSLDI